MLKVVRTEEVSNAEVLENENIEIPSSHCLVLADEAGNEYLVSVGKSAFDAVEEIQKLIIENNILGVDHD